VQWVLGLSQG